MVRVAREREWTEMVRMGRAIGGDGKGGDKKDGKGCTGWNRKGMGEWRRRE